MIRERDLLLANDRDPVRRERLLLIGARPSVTEFVRASYPEWDVAALPGVLEGIDDLTRGPARAVLIDAEAASSRLADAVAGVREAAGRAARILLCCPPQAEPLVRKVAAAGADDYLIYPLEAVEVDRALGYIRIPEHAGPDLAAPTASMDELRLLADLLANLNRDGFAILGKLADLVRLALGSQAATVVADGSAANSGGTVIEPVLAEPILREDRKVGQIMIGPRTKPYGPADLEKLRHYATLASHLLKAAGSHRQWRAAALTDEVSGLFNRRYLLQFLDDLLERARQERFRVTVLVFDIDNFKHYNDTYGHAAGDAIIHFIGRLFRTHCRQHDVVTRYGGDEFCVVFWDADQPRVAGSRHPSDALSVLRRVQDALRTSTDEALRALPAGSLTISGGLASFPWDAGNPPELLEKADHALLQAKGAGKNQVLIFGGDAAGLTPH